VANGYLGKISAIVTANTGDFKPKLDAAAKDVTSFAKSMQSTLASASSASSASLRAIYTEAQKFDRALAAATSRKLSFKGFDAADLGAAADKMRQLYSATNQVSKPLADAAKTFGKLSYEVQGEFLPALISAQKATEALASTINRTGQVGEERFGRVQQKVAAVIASMSRIREADALAGGLATGRELAFQQPGLVAEMQRSRALQAKALTLSPEALAGSQITGLVGQQKAAAAEAVRLHAALEKVRNSRNGDAGSAEAALNSQLALYSQINAQIEQQITNIERAAAARARDAEIEQSIGQFSRRATPVADLLRMRAEDERRARDAEIEQSIGQFSRRATPLGPGSGPGSPPVGTNYFADQLEREARRRMGGDIPGGAGVLGGRLDVGRQVDNITARVAAARQQIDSLPDPIRSALIPSLQDATNTAANLARAGFGATANQIRIAAAEAERLEQRVSRTRRGMEFGLQFGGQGRRGVEFGLQEISLRGYSAQLQVIQRALAGAASEARGPASGAFNQLRSAISQAAARGTLDVRGTRTEIERLTQEAVRAAAAAAGISPGRLSRAVGRAGDVGRGAFGNAGLAVQQAVFAFDDFMSVTGGLDQRIRAAGNNLSQLGFIVGGTAGLIAGVLTSAIAQVVVGYIKWQNAGVGTEDALRAMNGAIDKQRSLVDELAQSFSSLADEISRVGLSKQGSEASQLSKQLSDIRKKQQDFNRERFAELDPEVQRQRGIVEARERTLKETADPGERIRLQGEIVAARRAEKEAADRAMAAAPITAAEAARVAVESRRAVELQFATESESPSGVAGANANAAAAQGQMNARLAGARSQAEQMAIAQDQLLFEKNRLEREIESNNFFGAGLLAGGSNTVRRQQLVEVERALRQLEQAMVSAANKIEVETAGAAVRAARRIGVAQESVAKGIEAGVPGASGLQSELDTTSERLAEAIGEMDRAQKRARESGVGADYEAARKAEATVRSIAESINAREREAAAIEAAAAAAQLFATAFDKVRQEAEGNLQAAQAAADQRRGDSLEQGTAGSRARREQARADLERQQALRNDVRKETALAEERARQNVDVRRREEEIAAIDRQLESTGVLAPGQREALIGRREDLRDQNEAAVQSSVNNDPAVVRARDASTAEERRRQSAERGRQAAMTPAQKAGEELAGTLRDIRANFAAQPGGVIGNRRQLDEANRRAVEDSMRQQAPAIFNLADSVKNAVFQGPSRAALQASDTTTSQGAAELNRLIRGDDSAKNQDLVELQKQSGLLQQLVTATIANGAPPAVLDL